MITDTAGSKKLDSSLVVTSVKTLFTTFLDLMAVFSSSAGVQTVRVGQIELESVVPNSVPETFINVRGQSLTERL